MNFFCYRIENFIINWQNKERFENDLLLRNSIACLLPQISDECDKKLVILTICNTGSLATSSFGTALGCFFLLLFIYLIEKIEFFLEINS